MSLIDISTISPHHFYRKSIGTISENLNFDIKQLLDEVEHDIMNYQNLVSVLSAEAFGFGR